MSFAVNVLLFFIENSSKSVLFEEYEIVIESEPSENTFQNSYKVETEKYNKYLEGNKEGPVDKQIEKELKKMNHKSVDQYFFKFKERIDREPKQVCFIVTTVCIYVISKNCHFPQNITII